MSKYFQLSIIITILYIVLRAKYIVCFFTLQRWKQFTDKLQWQNRPETNHQEHNVDVAPEIKPVTILVPPPRHYKLVWREILQKRIENLEAWDSIFKAVFVSIKCLYCFTAYFALFQLVPVIFVFIWIKNLQ